MSDRSPSNEISPQRSPWSRPGVLISGAFLLLLIFAGIIVAVIGGASHHSTRTIPGRQVTVASTSPPAGSSSTACTLPAGNEAIPSASPPAGIRWAQVGSMQAPQAPSTLGPQRTSGVWNTCFAHNPSGALLAAMNLWAEGTAADPSAVFHRLGIGAPLDLGNSDRLDAGGPVQFAGYSYESYDPATARVLVVIRGPDGKLGAAATTMEWAGGDWKYLFPAGGALSIEVIADLTGYVQWSAF
jgi:hypothetical protein